MRYSKYSKMLIVEPRLWVVDIYIFTSLFQVFCMFKNFQNKILGGKKISGSNLLENEKL